MNIYDPSAVGYPLEYLPLPTPHKYTLCRMETPAVQQGVVDGDPDLDASFRLVKALI